MYQVNYHRASSVAEAARLLKDGEAKVLSGGMTLIPAMKTRLAAPTDVVDISRIAELKELLNTSDGNLSTHARKLEDAGYIACKKKFASRVPKTEYSLTVKGKKMFARHLEHMESLIQAAKGS